MEARYERIKLLIKDSGVERLKNSWVLVLGCGGVGSYAVESLARTGIGNIVIVDADTVAESNLNRQIMATYDTINKSKTQSMAERIKSYNPDCNVICVDKFYDENLNAELFQYPIDFVIDAIDTISAKVTLMKYCTTNKIPFISSMGMANRFDVTKLEITTLNKTYNDPMAKVIRNLVKKERIRGKVNVCFSTELPFKQTQIINENGKTRKASQPPASTQFVPAAAGMAMGSYAVQIILNK